MRRREALKVLAVLRTQETKDALSGVFAEVDAAKVDVVVGGLERVNSELLARHEPEILLLDVNLSDASEIDGLEQLIRSYGSEVGIVATSSEATLDGVRRLMRLDVADFLPQPVSRNDLVAALEHAARRSRRVDAAARSRAKIFTFIRPAGGMGASMLAVQFACCLANQKNKDRKKPEVCLLDLDIQFGNAAVYLDVQSEFSVLDLLHAQGRFDGAFLRGLMARDKSGLEVLASPVTLLPLEALTPELVLRLLEVASEEYDYIVIDTPHAWTDWMQVVLGHSDLILLVTQLSVAPIRQTRRLLECLADKGLGDIPLAVLLNRYQKRWAEKLTVKDAEKAVGRNFDCFIPSDYKTVSAALDAGVRLSTVSRRNKVEKTVDAFVASLLEEAGTKEGGRAEPTLAL